MTDEMISHAVWAMLNEWLVTIDHEMRCDTVWCKLLVQNCINESMIEARTILIVAKKTWSSLISAYIVEFKLGILIQFCVVFLKKGLRMTDERILTFTLYVITSSIPMIFPSLTSVNSTTTLHAAWNIGRAVNDLAVNDFSCKRHAKMSQPPSPPHPNLIVS